MRTQDIIIGEIYRHRTSPNYGYAKVIKILKPLPKFMQKYAYDLTEDEKNIIAVVVKCEWWIAKNDIFSFIKYFRPCDLIKDAEKRGEK